MRLLLKALLVGLAGLALVLPAIGSGASVEDPPTTPVETSPLPPEPAPGETEITLEVPPEPETITLEVPPLPAPAAKKASKPKSAVARPQSRRAVPSRVRSAPVPRASRRVGVSPAADLKPTPKAKAKKAKPKPKRAKPKPVAAKPPRVRAEVPTPVSKPERAVTQQLPVKGVLAAQFSLSDPDSTGNGQSAVLYLALALAGVLGMLLGLAAAAPLLAGRWPQVFVPVIGATERIVLAGVCLAGAALTLAITWALTGPAA